LKDKDNPPHKARVESTLCPPRTHNPRFGKEIEVGVATGSLVSFEA
jgi:hypothetical protein